MYCSKSDTVLEQHQSCGGMGKTHVLTEYNNLILLSTNAEFKVCDEQKVTIKYRQQKTVECCSNDSYL